MIDQLTDQYTAASNAVLDAVVEANRRVVDAVVEQATKVHTVVSERVTLDDRISDAVPTPAEAGVRYLDFVERAVAVNRDWNARVVEMIRQAPVVVTVTEDVPAATEATAKKAAARKTAAKKTVAKKAAAKKAPAKKTAAKKTAAKRSTAK